MNQERNNNISGLTKVGESTIYGVVVKYTKLLSANGLVEVEYNTGDIQVLENENGTWVEVEYIKKDMVYAYKHTTARRYMPIKK
jgi:hypothetical protein